MGKIIIGKIIKPQGIKGEVKIFPMTDDALRFKTLKEIYLANEQTPRKVIQTRISGQDVFMLIEGIIIRNDAEEIRNCSISINKEDAVKLDSGRYFIFDVIGSKVYTQKGNLIGTVKDIIKSRAADVYEISDKGKTFMFPLVDDLVLEMDIKAKKIVVEEKRFNEVVCYED